MKDFDTRWQTAIEAARSAPLPEDDTPPFGFAARVVALRQQRPPASPAILWQHLTWRALGLAAAILMASAVFNWSTSTGESPLSPAIADSMNDLLWLP